MRLRIIAYGVAVLVVLLVVSIVTFETLDWRRPGPPSAEQLAEIVNAPDAPTRQRLADDALETSHVEISLYRADGSLLVSNVRPALEPPFAAQGEALAAPPQTEGPPEALPRRARPSLDPLGVVPFVAAPARQRPGVLLIGDVAVVMRPSQAGPPLAPFAAPLVVTLVCLVLLSFPVTAAMTRKLEALAETARRFGEGDLSQRADVSGPSEVNGTARAFNQMAERIVELRQLERQLLANVSHELRTPMARMAVLLELLESRPTEASRYLSELSADLRELASLLDSIIETFRLDLASPRARELWLEERETLDLREVVTELAEDFRVQAPPRALTLTVPDGPVVVRVDRVLARRAVMNLLDNARKYSRPDSSIELTVEVSGDIVVRDHGQGISPADLPYVFEPFFRADRTRSPKGGEGLGLGLALVRMVAGFHNGAISVESERGRGSAFRLSLGKPSALAASA